MERYQKQHVVEEYVMGKLLAKQEDGMEIIKIIHIRRPLGSYAVVAAPIRPVRVCSASKAALAMAAATIPSALFSQLRSSVPLNASYTGGL